MCSQESVYVGHLLFTVNIFMLVKWQSVEFNVIETVQLKKFIKAEEQGAPVKKELRRGALSIYFVLCSEQTGSLGSLSPKNIFFHSKTRNVSCFVLLFKDSLWRWMCVLDLNNTIVFVCVAKQFYSFQVRAKSNIS